MLRVAFRCSLVLFLFLSGVLRFAGVKLPRSGDRLAKLEKEEIDFAKSSLMREMASAGSKRNASDEGAPSVSQEAWVAFYGRLLYNKPPPEYQHFENPNVIFFVFWHL